MCTKVKPQPVNSVPKVSSDGRNKAVKSYDGNRALKQNTVKTVLPNDAFMTAADILWRTAAASKAKKPKETQVWLDNDLYRKIEMLNIKHGKPVPTSTLSMQS
ncbi:hypothetical protein [Prevotella lacticifex]|nr:hypothetical protein [Prevotella lacticifex]